MPISVNMLRLRLTIDSQARTSSGHPAHSTTGVASASSIHVRAAAGITACAAIMPDISISISGTVSATLIQKRRVMSASSADGSSLALTTRGSSVIPQIGQLPGSEWTICGCIGQTYSVFEADEIGATGSSAMPHFGHDPGWSCRISGCIGHVYDAAAAAGFGSARFRKLSGLLLKRSRQLTPQKWYVVPLYSNDPALLAGSTCMPQTGSTTLSVVGLGDFSASEVWAFISKSFARCRRRKRSIAPPDNASNQMRPETETVTMVVQIECSC